MSMDSRFRKRWVESPVLIVVALLVLCGTGTALAASGVGSLVTNGDDGAVTARGAEQPISTFSGSTLTPPADTRTPPAETNVAGDTGAGNPGAANRVVNDAEVVGTGADPGGDAGLPFTGFLAIPLLILGAAMLLSGVALRRRSRGLAA